MEHIQAWGFLISRNQYLDYRTVVAPDFVCKLGESKLLAKAAEGELTGKSSAFYREIHDFKVGNLTLVYQVLEATAENTNTEGSGILKDSFGREIYLIEGLVFKGLLPDVVVTPEIFEAVHQRLVVYYREFWDCMSPQPAVAVEAFTKSIENSPNSSLERIKLIQLKPYANKTQKSTDISNEVPTTSTARGQSQSVESFPDEIASVAVSQDGSYIVIRHGRTILIKSWCGTSSTSLMSKWKSLGYYDTPVVISNDSQLIATGTIEGVDQNVVKLWDVKTKEEKRLGEHNFFGFSRIKAVAFTPDSKVVASGGGDKDIKLWDVKAEGVELGTLTGHTSEVRCIAISPDGRTLASGDGHGCIKLWNLITRNEIYTITRPNYYDKPINSLAFSPDGKFIAIASDECDVTLLDGRTAKRLCKIGEHLAPVNSVNFSPNGKLVASASDDHKIKIWDLKTEKEVVELTGHTKEVTSVAFSSDSQTLVSGSKDCTIRYWVLHIPNF